MSNWLSSSKGHWWYPLRASSLVNTLALCEAMSATASAGVEHWYLSRFTYLLRWERSTHILIFSVPFLGVTTIGAHHSVGAVTGAMMFCSCNRSSSALSLSRKAKGIVRGVLTQKGLASSVKAMWKYSPSMDLTLPSKTVGYSFCISPGGGTPMGATVGGSCGQTGVGY